MGTSKGGAPQPPNPVQMAQQQSNSNISTAAANSYLNAINQYGPQGNVIWKQVGTRKMGDGSVEIPEWQVHTELSPQQQKIFNAQEGATLGASELARDYTQRIRAATATPFSLNGLPQQGDAPTYNEGSRVAALERILARNSPAMQRDEEALRTRMRNQGLVPGTDAWKNAYGDFTRGQNDFRLGADIQAGGEAARDFDIASRIFGMKGDIRSRAINERLLERNQPINEVTALLGLGPGVQMPQQLNTQQQPIAPTDTMTPQMMAYQGQMQNWQAGQNANNALMGSIFGLAGSALGGWGSGGFKKFW
jgi:hypothetical protein